MKFPRKLRPFSLAFVTFGILASYSAFAVTPVIGGGVILAKGASGLPDYYIAAAALDNPAYIACIQAKAKSGVANVVSNVDVALDCQTTRN